MNFNYFFFVVYFVLTVVIDLILIRDVFLLVLILVSNKFVDAYNESHSLLYQKR